MPIYMTHPDHGIHIVYTPEDAKAHEGIGWTVRPQKVHPNAPVDSAPPCYAVAGSEFAIAHSDTPRQKRKYTRRVKDGNCV